MVTPPHNQDLKKTCKGFLDSYAEERDLLFQQGDLFKADYID